MGCIVATTKKINLSIVKEDNAYNVVSKPIVINVEAKSETPAIECKYEKVRNESYISNTDSKHRKKSVAKSFVENSKLNRSSQSASGNKSHITKRRRNTLLMNPDEDGEEQEMTAFDMVNKNLYSDLVEFTLQAADIKYAKWFPYVTMPGKELAIFAKGKWTIDESKKFVSCLGYPGQEAGNLVVKRLGYEESLPVNDLNNKILVDQKVPLLFGFNMGKYADYNPRGYLQIKLLGCKKMKLENTLPNYSDLCTSLSLQLENELNEEIKQVLYFIDCFRTNSPSYYAKYRETEDKLSTLEYKDDLTEMTTMFINANNRGNLSEPFKENSKKTLGITNKIEYLEVSFKKGHDSAYLKVLKLLENAKSRDVLENDSFNKIGLVIKAGKVSDVIMGILLAED